MSAGSRPKDESLRERVERQVERVRRYADWAQYVSVAILIIALAALVLGLVSQTLRLDWWLILVLSLILAGTLVLATLARRLAQFAHIIVRIFAD